MEHVWDSVQEKVSVMAARISGSVGSYESKAKNISTDIKTVQNLLAQAASKSRKPQFNPGTPDGKIARIGSRSSTVRAITAFQKEQVKMVRPDQRIDGERKHMGPLDPSEWWRNAARCTGWTLLRFC